MKKFIFLCLSIFIFASLQAQNFNGGIVAGMIASQYDGDSYAGFNRLGGTAGGFVNYQLHKKWIGQMEMKYIQKGSYRSPDQNSSSPVEYDLRLNYVEVPFLIKYNFKYHLSFEAGMGLAYLFSSREEVNGIPADPLNNSPFRKLEWDYQIGGYYSFLDKWAINIRYMYSILPIRSHAGGGVWGTNRGEYNNLISFSLHYQFKNFND